MVATREWTYQLLATPDSAIVQAGDALTKVLSAQNKSLFLTQEEQMRQDFVACLGRPYDDDPTFEEEFQDFKRDLSIGTRLLFYTPSITNVKLSNYWPRLISNAAWNFNGHECDAYGYWLGGAEAWWFVFRQTVNEQIKFPPQPGDGETKGDNDDNIGNPIDSGGGDIRITTPVPRQKQTRLANYGQDERNEQGTMRRKEGNGFPWWILLLIALGLASGCVYPGSSPLKQIKLPTTPPNKNVQLVIKLNSPWGPQEVQYVEMVSSNYTGKVK